MVPTGRRSDHDGPKPAGCLRSAGLGTLKDLGLLQEAAKKNIAYSTLAATVPARTDVCVAAVDG